MFSIGNFFLCGFGNEPTAKRMFGDIAGHPGGHGPSSEDTCDVTRVESRRRELSVRSMVRNTAFANPATASQSSSLLRRGAQLLEFRRQAR